MTMICKYPESSVYEDHMQQDLWYEKLLPKYHLNESDSDET